MDKMDKVAILRNEIDFIEDTLLKEFVRYCVEEAPAYTLGEDGLIKHTKAAVKIAKDLLSLEQNSHLPKDEIIAALILHELILHDGSNYMVAEHPLYAVDFIEQKFEDFEFEVDCGDLDELREQVTNIQRLNCSLILNEWSNSEASKMMRVNIMTLIRSHKPQEEDEKFVRICDYLASRKYLTCEVD